MDLKKIERLAKLLQVLDTVKFVAKTHASTDSLHHVVLSGGINYLGKETAEDVADELNGAIEPIIARLESQMRGQLALCATVKD